MAAFLKNAGTLPPLTLSIEGAWGSGKSSFMRQLQAAIETPPRDYEPPTPSLPQQAATAVATAVSAWWRDAWAPASAIAAWTGDAVRKALRMRPRKPATPKAPEPLRDPAVVTVWFNPWRHDKEEAVWAAFALEFLRGVTAKLPFRERWRGHWKLLWTRFSWRDGWMDAVRAIAAFVAALGLVVFLVYTTLTTNLLDEFATQLADGKDAPKQGPTTSAPASTTANAPAANANPPAATAANPAAENANPAAAAAGKKEEKKDDAEKFILLFLLRMGGFGASLAVAVSFLKHAKAFV
ncbi:MAG TPA: P-loop NTPase fold protein, partial [Longimicrobiaceae bacterium]